MLHIVKHFKRVFVSSFANNFTETELSNFDNNLDGKLSLSEVKEINGKMWEKLRWIISSLSSSTTEKNGGILITEILSHQWEEIVSSMKNNQKLKDSVSAETSNDTDNLKNNMENEISLKDIDVSKFTRTLKMWVSDWSDIAELNKFLLIKLNMFSIEELWNLEHFSRKTYTMLWNYQRRFGSKNPDGALSISKTTEFWTLKSIKKDLSLALSNEKKSDKKIQKEKEPELKLSNIDTSKFTRSLKKGVSSGDDVAELNKFLLLNTKMFSVKDLWNLEDFSSNTYAMLWNYQRDFGSKNPDWELTISKTKEYSTLKNIKLDVKEDLVNNIIEENNYNHVTKEENWNYRTVEKTNVTMDIDLGFGKTDFIWLRENIDYDSYFKVIKWMSFTELSSFRDKMKAVADTYRNVDSNGESKKYYNWDRVGYSEDGELRYVYRVNDKKDHNKIRYWDLVKDENGNLVTSDKLKVKNSFGPFSSSMKEVFIEEWYSADWIFAWIELGSLINLFDNAYRTQLTLNTTSKFHDKMSVIFDYSEDGILDGEKHFYTYEREMFENVETKEEFSNLLINLGYESSESFFNGFWDNYNKSRTEFKARLATALSGRYSINPGDLLRRPDALDRFNEHKEKVSKTVSEEIEKNEYIKHLPENVKREIHAQSFWVILWAKAWFGFGFDIAELTNEILDSISFGVYGWVFWFAITKRLKFANDRVNVDLWAVNLIPYVGVSVVAKKWEIDNFTEMFPNKFDSSAEVTIWWAVSYWWGMIWIDLSNHGIETKRWIAEAKEKMSWVLDDVFEEIKDWKTFERSIFSSNPEDRVVYERMAEMTKGKDFNYDSIKEGALNNYERSLYENASDWINYVWTTVWLAFISWYLPVPLILVHGEDSSVDWYEKPSYSYDWYMNEHLEWTDKLLLDISKYESAFSWKTRYNKWALDLMTPSNSQDVRWDWLVRLSKNTWALRESGLPKFLETIKEEDKQLVLSTFNQYMKRAEDFANWDVKLWNEKVEEYISEDLWRRKGFDKLFWFSLSEESTQYYKQLNEAKWSIWKTKIVSLWFDAASSIQVEWKSVKWVDTLYAGLNILTVKWEPLLIDITDKSKIEAFKKTILALDSLPDKMKARIISGLNNGTTTLKYYKDPDGFDDRILPYDSLAKQITVLWSEYNTTYLGLGITWESEKRDKGDSDVTWDGSIDSEIWEENQWTWTEGGQAWTWTWGSWTSNVWTWFSI